MNRKVFRLMVCGHIMAQKSRLRFGTLTVRMPCLPLRVVADMWRSFSNSRFWRGLVSRRDYMMVYEPHPQGHGWHIHFVCNFFIPIRDLVREAGRYGFGVCWMEIIDSSGVSYIAKYLSKSSKLARAEGSRSVRLVNVSRSLVPLRDIDVRSPMIDYVRSNWRTETGSPYLRWQKLVWRWLLSWCPSLLRLTDVTL